MSKEPTVTCLHSENIENNIGTCSLCTQQREYDPSGREKPKLLKRGRINGVLTEITPTLPTDVPPASAPVATKTTLKPIILVPSNWDKLSKSKKHKWLEEHKGEILKDIEELGEPAARKRWGLSASTWAGLKRRWKVGKIKAYTQRIKQPESKAQIETSTGDEATGAVPLTKRAGIWGIWSF